MAPSHQPLSLKPPPVPSAAGAAALHLTNRVAFASRSPTYEGAPASPRSASAASPEPELVTLHQFVDAHTHQ